jgi:hypothetical protein
MDPRFSVNDVPAVIESVNSVTRAIPLLLVHKFAGPRLEMVLGVGTVTCHRITVIQKSIRKHIVRSILEIRKRIHGARVGLNVFENFKGPVKVPESARINRGQQDALEFSFVLMTEAVLSRLRDATCISVCAMR